MPSGLQVFNSVGRVFFDFTDISYVIYGVGDTFYSNGSIIDDTIDANTIVFVYYIEDSYYKDKNIGDRYSAKYAPTFLAYPLLKIEIGKISWSYNATMASKYAKVRYKFFYGGPPK